MQQDAISSSQNASTCVLFQVQYKEGLAATGVSFCSDGSVLAVAYTPKDESEVMKGKKQHHHGSGQGARASSPPQKIPPPPKKCHLKYVCLEEV